MFELKSDGFEDGLTMPERFANTGVTGGRNISPALAWSGAPEGTMSYALICVDWSPVANEWVHWAVVGIPKDVSSIPEDASGAGRLPPGARELLGTSGRSGYQGPQPPQGTGPHEYEFKLSALDTGTIEITGRPSFKDFETAILPRTLATASIKGIFER